jgi:hypothetical protein
MFVTQQVKSTATIFHIFYYNNALHLSQQRLFYFSHILLQQQRLFFTDVCNPTGKVNSDYFSHISFLAGSIRTAIWYCVIGEAGCNWYLLILINSLYRKKINREMPSRRYSTRLNAEDMLIILQQYNAFLLWVHCSGRYTTAFTASQSSSAAE